MTCRMPSSTLQLSFCNERGSFTILVPLPSVHMMTFNGAVLHQTDKLHQPNENNCMFQISNWSNWSRAASLTKFGTIHACRTQVMDERCVAQLNKQRTTFSWTKTLWQCISWQLTWCWMLAWSQHFCCWLSGACCVNRISTKCQKQQVEHTREKLANKSITQHPCCCFVRSICQLSLDGYQRKCCCFHGVKMRLCSPSCCKSSEHRLWRLFSHRLFSQSQFCTALKATGLLSCL